VDLHLPNGLTLHFDSEPLAAVYDRFSGYLPV
jgi:hypothetical protein